MNSGESANTGKIWGLAAVAAVLAFFALKTLADYTFWPALLLAILIGILVAILLWIGFFRDAESEMKQSVTPAPEPSALASSAVAETSKAADVPSEAGAGAKTGAKAPPPVAEPAKKSVTAPAGAKKAAAKVAAVGVKKKARTTEKAKSTKAKSTKAKSTKAKSTKAKSTGAAKPRVTKKAAAKSATEKAKQTTAQGKSAAKKAKSTATSLMGEAGAAMVVEKKAEKAKSARKPVAKNGKPPVIRKARAGGADDLKQIKGVGPALEKTLNELGFYHFDQVAGWRKREIEWVDERLRFKGRIERDGWTKQCRILAKGGTTEFSKRVKKGDVY